MDSSFASNTNLGLPATYPCAMFSMWLNVPSGALTFNFINSIGGSSGVDFGLSATGPSWDCGNAIGNTIGFGSGTAPITSGQLVHYLASIDAVGNQVQIYVNDAAVTLSNTWQRSQQIGRADGQTGQYGGPGFNGDVICIGDLWFSNQPSFTDLSVVANRRKFINSDLTPVDLGANGEIPFSSTPPVYLHVPLGNTASDFMTNYGTGGGFNGFARSFGMCMPPTASNNFTSTPSTNGADLTWNIPDTGGGASSTNLQYRKVGDLAFTALTGLGFATTLTGLIQNTAYEWQVQLVNTAGSSAFSALQSFTTLRGATYLNMDNLLASAPAPGTRVARPRVAIYW